MICAVDSSVLVAALVTSEPHHAGSAALLDQGGLLAHVHVLAELFSALTGGRILPRVRASQAEELIRDGIVPFISTAGLSAREYLAAMGEAESRGVRGGAIHDFLHLYAAKRRKAARLYTLDVTDFKSFHRPGDPEIVCP